MSRELKTTAPPGLLSEGHGLQEWTGSFIPILEPPNNCPGLIRTAFLTVTKITEEDKGQELHHLESYTGLYTPPPTLLHLSRSLIT